MATNKMCEDRVGPGLPTGTPTMSRWSLGLQGWTDSTLEAERARRFGARAEGELWLDDRSTDTSLAMSAYRASVFARVTSAAPPVPWDPLAALGPTKDKMREG